MPHISEKLIDTGAQVYFKLKEKLSSHPDQKRYLEWVKKHQKESNHAEATALRFSQGLGVWMQQVDPQQFQSVYYKDDQMAVIREISHLLTDRALVLQPTDQTQSPLDPPVAIIKVTHTDLKSERQYTYALQWNMADNRPVSVDIQRCPTHITDDEAVNLHWLFLTHPPQQTADVQTMLCARQLHTSTLTYSRMDQKINLTSPRLFPKGTTTLSYKHVGTYADTTATHQSYQHYAALPLDTGVKLQDILAR